MDIQIDPAVGRVFGILLSIAIAGILGSLLFGRVEDDKEKGGMPDDRDTRNTANQQGIDLRDMVSYPTRIVATELA